MFETLLFFFKQKYVLFLETHFLRFLILGFFFVKSDTRKHRRAPAQTSNTALVKPTD